MKYLLSIILILYCSLALAFPPGFITAMTSGGSSGAVTCTGGLTLYLSFESTDIILGNPSGCSAGSTTLILSDSTLSNIRSSDGSYSNLLDSGYEYSRVSVSSRDIVDERAGTIIFDFYMSNVTGYHDLVYPARFDNDNTFKIQLNGSEMEVVYKGSGGAPTVLSTTGAGLLSGQWYTATVKWDQNGTNKLSINVNSVTSTTTSALTAWGSLPSNVFIGTMFGDSPAANVDKLKIYNYWLP